MNKGFSSVSDVMSDTENLNKLKPLADKYKVLKLWKEIAKGFLSETETQTQAIDFKKGVLYIACLSKDLALQIRLQTARIMNALNSVLGRRAVFAINVEF